MENGLMFHLRVTFSTLLHHLFNVPEGFRVVPILICSQFNHIVSLGLKHQERFARDIGKLGGF